MLTEVFIIEPDPIVRMDLVELSSQDMGIARVHDVGDRAVAHSALISAGRSSCILVNGEVAVENKSIGSSLIAAATRGARIIVLGSRQILPFPAEFVDIPFTPDMIVSAFSKMQATDYGG